MLALGMKLRRLADLLLRVCKQLPDILLTLPNKFVQDFRSIDNLWLSRIEHLSNLPRHEGLSSTGRAKQQDTCDDEVRV